MRGILEGKVAIITGAARGQGADEARAFVAEGAKVIVSDVRLEVADLALELGSSAHAIVHDVTEEAQWKAVVATAVETFGKVDILVNNAGILSPGHLTETSKEQFEGHFRVNQLGVFLGMRAVHDAMVTNGGGSIINISSGAGLRGYPGMLAYLSTKWAVRGMTKAVARELAPKRIRVNSVHPGLIETPMIAGDTGATDVFSEIAASIPIGRIGQTADVVSVVLHLASDASGYMTGAEIAIDGGTGL